VGEAVYAIDDFPDDDLLWRIEWIGGVGYNTSVPSDPLMGCLHGTGARRRNPVLSTTTMRRFRQRIVLPGSRLHPFFLASSSEAAVFLFLTERMRLSLGSWSSCLRMYSQSFLVSSVRGSGSFADHCGQCGVGLHGFAKGVFRGGGFLRGWHRAIRTRRAWEPSEKSILFSAVRGSASANLSRVAN
jgi:hypothetical protein